MKLFSKYSVTMRRIINKTYLSSRVYSFPQNSDTNHSLTVTHTTALSQHAPQSSDSLAATSVVQKLVGVAHHTLRNVVQISDTRKCTE